METNIKQFGYSPRGGIILNEWRVPVYDADGYDTVAYNYLAITYGQGYDGGDELRLIMRTNGDDVAPETSDVDAWKYMLEDLGSGDVACGARHVFNALDWAEEHLDQNKSCFRGAIDEMREITGDILKHDEE